MERDIRRHYGHGEHLHVQVHGASVFLRLTRRQAVALNALCEMHIGLYALKDGREILFLWAEEDEAEAAQRDEVVT